VGTDTDRVRFRFVNVLSGLAQVLYQEVRLAVENHSGYQGRKEVQSHNQGGVEDRLVQKRCGKLSLRPSRRRSTPSKPARARTDAAASDGECMCALSADNPDWMEQFEFRYQESSIGK
jgi:hypothetical protein